ncbi:protein phosphatase 1 regulatory subunit 3D [Erpetoichthys calabaricus]|uniref:protein phosphatase 1 regulatory subunit 3D n=1 Tax=Erpetoichthys calabaricus TaxID=27687 RepID=UPI00109F0B21|nr:protein phosphatase 1 regulatory subunit 3D [Erpetoichthys calabaricus]
MDNAAAHTAVSMPPPRNCLPRNYSCMAVLFGGTVTDKKEEWESEKEEPPEAPEIQVIEERPRGRDTVFKPQSPTLRRRAKSLPAPTERAKLEISRARSPSSQKKVRFADSLGLELISVKHFCHADVPEVPRHVMARLQGETPPNHLNNLDMFFRVPRQSTFLETQFPNPCHSSDFLEQVRAMNVCLEKVETSDFCLSGVIRVVNVAFEKGVTVRYTLNNWVSFVDVVATYVQGSSEDDTDQFAFKLVIPTLIETGGTMQFAIKYCVGGSEYWDNNGGNNYKVRSHRFRMSPPKEWESAWIHFI